MSTSLTNITDLERQFQEAVKSSMLSLKDAGCILLKIWESTDESYKDNFKAKYRLAEGVIKTLLKIGKGEILPEIASYPSRFKSLPIEDQKKVADKQVRALILQENGKTEEIIVDVLTAPRDLVNQVIAKDHIRSLSEQRAYLTSVANRKISMREAKKAKECPWKVIPGGKVIIGNITLTLDEILLIAQAIRNAR